MQRIRTRRNKAEDAFNALDRLLVIKSGESGGTLTRCFQKRKNSCPLFDLNYVSKLRFEKAYETFNARDEDERRKRSAGAALRFYNQAMLTEVPALLGAIPEITASIEPELKLAKTKFKAGEQIEVRFTAPACFSSRSWVGIVQSAIPHGSEEVNLREQTGQMSFLKRQEQGELGFIAPTEPGEYDLRMNNSGTGREVQSISFTVKSNKPRSVPFIEAQKSVFTTEEQISFEYAVLLPKSRWIIGVAKESSPVVKPMSFLPGLSLRGDGNDYVPKLKPGNYEIRIVQIRVEAQVGHPKFGSIIYEKVLAKDSFIVE
jgi:hypothetical protein